MLEKGHIVERYQIEKIIGRGGMAMVYLVRHTQLRSLHALKVLSAPGTTMAARMLQEGRMQATLHHANVVSVHDVLDMDGIPALVMELIPGPTLARWMERSSPDLDTALDVFRGIVRGVRHAHDRGFVHRDLKPSNILLAKKGDRVVPKVCDFGLAKLLHGDAKVGDTRTGTSMGTPEYMSPEQIRDTASVDKRADMFSLGCLLYELVCGVKAFQGEDIVSKFNAVTQGTFIPPRELVPDLPDAVVQAIEGLLKVDPDERMSTCTALLELMGDDPEADDSLSSVLLEPLALEDNEDDLASFVLGASTVHVPPELLDELKRKPTVRRRISAWASIVVAMGGALVLGVGIFAFGLIWLAEEPAPSGPMQETPAPASQAQPVDADPPEATVDTDLEGQEEVEAPEDDEDRKDRRRRRSSRSHHGADVEASASPWESSGAEKVVESAPSGGFKDPIRKVKVRASGDAERVWLVTADERLLLPMAVYPGRYSIHAYFEGATEPVAAGEVEIAPGGTRRIRCDAFLLRCR